MQRGAQKISTQLASIPAFKDNPVYADGSSVRDSLFPWFRKGIRCALCIFNDGQSAVFIGKEGKLYQLGRGGNGDHVSTPKEITTQDGEPWQLPNSVDMSCVKVVCTDINVLVLDSEMKLYCIPRESPMEQLLPKQHVAQVSCSSQHYLVLTSDGIVHSCGINNDGQLGLGHSNAVTQLTPIVLHLGHARFGTQIACGNGHSVVLCEQGFCFTFGNNSFYQLGHTTNQTGPNHTPSVPHKKVQFVKAACGANHSLFLTPCGSLWGCGQGGLWQLGKLGIGNYILQELSLSAVHGTPVDIFCHARLNVSVVLTDKDEFYICGQAGSLFHVSAHIEDFLLYEKSAVIIKNEAVCMKPSGNCINIPGFNDPEACDVELKAHDDSPGSGGEGEERTRSVFVGLDAVKMRSPYLWNLLKSPLQACVTTTGDRKFSVKLTNYSYKAIHAYGKYIHEDEVDCEPQVAVELLELAREYMDIEGLSEQSARLARRSVTAENLPVCLRACIDLGHLPLAVELVKLRLCLDNCCDVLQIAEKSPAGDPHAMYIKEVAMAFAVEHAASVVKSPQYQKLVSDIKGRMLAKLVEKDLLVQN